ncbi:MAG: 3-deoxy-7-phosphoheptulonate synthase, partial [Planctomycetia bacterium]
LADVVRQVRAGNSPLMGFMVESNLNAGNQPLRGGRDGLAYGVSITDGCIGWDETEELLLEAHRRLG